MDKTDPSILMKLCARASVGLVQVACLIVSGAIRIFCMHVTHIIS